MNGGGTAEMPGPSTIDEYLARVPEERRAPLGKLRGASTAPKARELLGIRPRSYFVAATQIALFSVRTRPSSVTSGAHASVTFRQIRSCTRVKAEAECRSALADPDVVTLRALELGLDWTLGPA